MTLDTRVYVLDEIEPELVFGEMRRLLEADERHPIRDKEAYAKDGSRTMMHPAGMGLSAWLMLDYRPDAPLRAEDYREEYPEDDYVYVTPACYLEVSFDTAYGYRDEQGRGCGEFHAYLVAMLGQWLDERNVRWSWKNEFTGDIHTGDERYSSLTELISSGDEAQAWFHGSVLPAIFGLELGGI